jgi:thiol-disulfide isomerase/thioredoxin
MGGKAAIGGGLVTGLLVGAGLVAGVVVLTPGPVAPTRTPVSEPAATTSPSSSTATSPDASGGSPAATTPEQAFGIGEPARPLAVPRLGGGEISLAALEGKPVWVNFMATSSLPSVDELPLMNGYAARYAAAGLVVLAIDVREDEPTVDAFVRQLNLTFPVGLDADGAAQAAWGANALPVHFWIDAEGIVRDGALGGIGTDVMARGLQTILPGVTVTP